MADFDALIEYVELFKKHFERKSGDAAKSDKPSSSVDSAGDVLDG